MNSQRSFAPPKRQVSRDLSKMPKLTIVDEKKLNPKSEEIPVYDKRMRDSDRLSISSYASLKNIDLEQNYGLLRDNKKTKTLSSKEDSKKFKVRYD